MNNQEKYIHIDKEELYDFFIVKNNTRKACSDHFNCSEATIKKKCRQYGISKKPKDYIKNTNKKLLENHGTTELWNISNEKRYATNIKKFGKPKPFQSNLIQDKVAELRRSKYSNEETIVKEILNELSIPFEKEYVVNIDGTNHYFDFAVLINNDIVLIETDGIFHIKDIYGKERLQRSIREEQKKNEYCFNKDIKLYRIPYFLTTETKNKLIEEIISPD